MRRSVREAIVGFSLLTAVTGVVGFSFWLRGLSLTRQYWSLKASFNQASGLAERSPVTYRGVMVGSVRSVRITPEAVIAQLEITHPDLRLPLPARAEIGQASLLGGEAQVALISSGKALESSAPSPRSPDCPRTRMLCDGSSIPGTEGPSLSSVTTLMYELLAETENEQLVSKFGQLADRVEQTSKDASSFLEQGKVLAKNLDQSVDMAKPTITNLNASSAHLRQLIAALNNPRTVAELQQTVTNAEQLTARWDAVGGDVNKLTADPRFMDGLRSVAVGLGAFFEELYPAKTAAAQDKAERERAAKEKEKDPAAEAGKQAHPEGSQPKAFPMPATP